MKKSLLSCIILFVGILFYSINIKAETICYMTVPMGWGIIKDEYSFEIKTMKNPLTKKNETYYEIRYGQEYSGGLSQGGLLSNIFTSGEKKLVNVGPMSGIESYFTDSQITSIKHSSECPKYVWIGPVVGYNPKEYGVMFSNNPIDISRIGQYYNSYYEMQDDVISDSSAFDEMLKEYNELYAKLNNTIEGNYAKRCSDLKDALQYKTSFRIKKETLTDYAKKDSSLSFDPAEGDDLIRRFELAEGYCNSEDYDIETGGNKGSYNEGNKVSGCEVIPEEIRKWIVNILKFIRYVALALVVALGALDFMKAAGSGEADAMKKAGQTFMKRLIAVAILFLLPVLVDFILNMVNLYGVDPNNVDCLQTPTNP